jgi:hypothetical protein
MSRTPTHRLDARCRPLCEHPTLRDTARRTSGRYRLDASSFSNAAAIVRMAEPIPLEQSVNICGQSSQIVNRKLTIWYDKTILGAAPSVAMHEASRNFVLDNPLTRLGWLYV